jgi:hypothetical protein
VNVTDKNIKIILIVPETFNIGQQVYSDATLTQLTGSTAFKNIQELQQYLIQARSGTEKWVAADHLSLQITSQNYAIRLPMTPLTDSGEVAKIALMRATLGGGGEPAYNAVAAKLKGIGELFEKLHQTSDQHTRQLSEMARKMAQTDNRVG